MITETTPECTGLAKIEIDTDGMYTKHNYPCPVCQTQHAVLNTSNGCFEPCWSCKRKDWHTIQAKSRFLKWLLRRRHIHPEKY
jgi:hypothetical protein